MTLLRDVVLQRARNVFKASVLRKAARKRLRGVTGLPSRATAYTANCELCGASAVPHSLLGPVGPTACDRTASTAYRLVQCHRCDVVYLAPAPSAADLKSLYEETVQFDDARFDSGADRITRSYERRIRHLRLLDDEPRRVLEVGAGLAWICRVAKRRSPRSTTVAQDVSAECALRCPWVDDYVVGTIDDLASDRQFDLVSLTHVLEHVPHPRTFLKMVARRVSAGGSVYITAPHRPPFWKRRDGLGPWLQYEYLHVPAHVAYLSKRWLREAAEAAGLRLVHWDRSHDGYQVFEAVLRRPD